MMPWTIGLPAGGRYLRVNLWTHKVTHSGATISARVPPHGVAFYRVRPARWPGPRRVPKS